MLIGSPRLRRATNASAKNAVLLSRLKKIAKLRFCSVPRCRSVLVAVVRASPHSATAGVPVRVFSYGCGGLARGSVSCNRLNELKPLVLFFVFGSGFALLLARSPAFSRFARYPMSLSLRRWAKTLGRNAPPFC